MTTAAVITFIAIAGIVWGGFIGLVVKALSRERGKARTAARGATSPPDAS
jgi:hypothetical protein